MWQLGYGTRSVPTTYDQEFELARSGGTRAATCLGPFRSTGGPDTSYLAGFAAGALGASDGLEGLTRRTMMVAARGAACEVGIGPILGVRAPPWVGAT